MRFREQFLIGAAVFGLFGTIVFGTMLVNLRHDLRLPLAKDRVGLEDRISERSKDEILALVKDKDFIIGGWVQKRVFQKTDNPVFYHWGQPIVHEHIANFERIQKAGKGHESADLVDNAGHLLSNPGLIKCVPIETSIIPEYTPQMQQHAQMACVGTIPPFSDNVNLVIMMVINAEEWSADLEEARRLILRLQIDIYNRDYKGQETWSGAY